MGSNPSLYSRKDWNRMRRKSSGLFQAPEPMGIGGLGHRKEEYRDCDFSGYDFRNVTFGGVYFWPPCSFKGCDFRGAVFSGAHFENADFQGADFRGCTFRSTDFSSCNLTNARFKGVTMEYSGPNPEGDHVWMTGVSFKGADLTGVSDFDPEEFLCAAYWKEIKGNPKLLARTEAAAQKHFDKKDEQAAERKAEASREVATLRNAGKSWNTSDEFDALWSLADNAEDADFKRKLFRQFVENTWLRVEGIAVHDEMSAEPVSIDDMIAFLDGIDFFDGSGGIDTYDCDAGYIKAVQSRGWNKWSMFITQSPKGGYAYMSSEKERN